ncbi:MAG: hypothetical protein ACI9JL_000987 [Paracoccaceae bacterium]|jgi:hypothetical protein
MDQGLSIAASATSVLQAGWRRARQCLNLVGNKHNKQGRQMSGTYFGIFDHLDRRPNKLLVQTCEQSRMAPDGFVGEVMPHSTPNSQAAE